MKILVLESSPNRHGSSNMLAGEFIRGAEEAGYRVQVVDVAHADIHPCSGCVACGYEGPARRKTTWNRSAQIFSRPICSFL